MSASPEAVLQESLELQVKDQVYVVPLKENKQTISLRVLPEAVRVLDKFTVINGDISRTRLIEKLVESLALAILSAKYQVKTIVLAVIDKSNQVHLSAVAFNPSKAELEDLRRRLYYALFG